MSDNSIHRLRGFTTPGMLGFLALMLVCVGWLLVGGLPSGSAQETPLGARAAGRILTDQRIPMAISPAIEQQVAHPEPIVIAGPDFKAGDEPALKPSVDATANTGEPPTDSSLAQALPVPDESRSQELAVSPDNTTKAVEEPKPAPTAAEVAVVEKPAPRVEPKPAPRIEPKPARKAEVARPAPRKPEPQAKAAERPAPARPAAEAPKPAPVTAREEGLAEKKRLEADAAATRAAASAFVKYATGQGAAPQVRVGNMRPATLVALTSEKAWVLLSDERTIIVRRGDVIPGMDGSVMQIGSDFIKVGDVVLSLAS